MPFLKKVSPNILVSIFLALLLQQNFLKTKSFYDGCGNE
jgi:hypothetical protein